jgi:NadR type nicotinamide-nucleotide adenylyltransferase
MPERLGLVLGKFMPPHRGHETLIRFARSQVDRLVVHVCSVRKEPIPGELRYQWMRETFPDCEVVHHDDEVPSYPHECATPEEFYAIWRRTLLSRMERAPDFVFAGEGYGLELAEALGARFIPLSREEMPFDLCATDARQDPGALWDAILPAARPYYLRRVAIVGPESVGKSTLAARLAKRFGTIHVPEYGRTYTDIYGMDLRPSDLEAIAQGHRALEDALAPQARRFLISDTDAVVTAMWSRYLLGEVPPLVAEYAATPRYDLYLLLPPTLPWTQDGTRVQEDREVRQWFFEGCQEMLAGRRCVTLEGGWDERFTQAVHALQSLA